MMMPISQVIQEESSESDSEASCSHDDQANSNGVGVDSDVPSNDWTEPPLDVVTFDGTWSKRGYTAMYGVGVVTSWDTGHVLDQVVLSKYCRHCSQKMNSLGIDEVQARKSLEFQTWYADHEDHCTLNHRGTSALMELELETALELWKRSVERLNLRYVNVVSDGDSKAITAVQIAEPYGSGVCITKYECVGHVQKRVGYAFITLSKNPPIEIIEIVVKRPYRLEKPLRDALP